jgi:hypothetical protein
MSRRTFTSDQMKNISKNRNVARCGDRSVRYSRGFKALALRQYNEEGLSAVGIFLEAGFDLGVIGKRTPNRLMNQWKTALRPKRSRELALQGQDKAEVAIKRIRNGREMSKLKAKVTYLEAENHFLKKLRAGKRE